MTGAPDPMNERLAAIRLLSIDVDGVLTDGGLYYADDGSQMRKFNVRDGVGLKAIRAAGIEVAIISASKSPSITHRGRYLGLSHVYIGVENKLAVLTDLCEGLGIELAAVAHIGDDANDLEILEAVGCPITVADAIAPVLDIAVYVTEKRGGDGAVREVCDRMLAARGATGEGI